MANPLLYVAALLALAMVGAAWLPRSIVAVPVAVLVAATAAFALGGAVAGTLMPQLGASLIAPGLEPDSWSARRSASPSRCWS